MPDLAALLLEASTARPAYKARTTGKWAPLFDVFRQLRSRRFSGPAAVDWMIERGAIQTDERELAIQAFRTIEFRARKKEAACA